MNAYDVYRRFFEDIGLGKAVMSPDQFTSAIAAAERNEPTIFSSVIDMDAFETAVRR